MRSILFTELSFLNQTWLKDQFKRCIEYYLLLYLNSESNDTTLALSLSNLKTLKNVVCKNNYTGQQNFGFLNIAETLTS